MIGLFDLTKCVHMSITIAPPPNHHQNHTTKLLTCQLELILPSFSLSFPVHSTFRCSSEERNPHESVVAQVFRAVRGWLRQLLDGRRCRVYKTKALVARPTKEVWTGSRRELAKRSIWWNNCNQPAESSSPESRTTKEENGGKQRSFHATVRPYRASYKTSFNSWINCKTREKNWRRKGFALCAAFC